MIQVSYANGVPDPLSLHVDSYNTVDKEYTDKELVEII